MRSNLIWRNYGPILGSLEEIEPFLLIGRYGARWRELRDAVSPTHAGLFSIGHSRDRDRPEVSHRAGLILPVTLCGNPRVREGLLAIPPLVDQLAGLPLREQRARVQTHLDAVMGGDLQIAEHEWVSAFFALAPTRAFFGRLRDEFEYVISLEDALSGRAKVLETRPFAWGSLGELMEWYHGATDRWEFPWDVFKAFFVFGDTRAFTRYYRERWAWRGLAVPPEDHGRWYSIRPDVNDAEVDFQLAMGEEGWADLTIRLDGSALLMMLSELYDPFPELVAWGQKIDQGDLPIQMEVDEEGPITVLTVIRTGDPDRVYFRVSERNENRTHLEAIVSRRRLAQALKEELKRFFESEFDPRKWVSGEPEPDCAPLRDRVLGHSWFHG